MADQTITTEIKTPEDLDKLNIVLFDGICNLCSSLVQFILKHQGSTPFHFIPLQSDLANKILDFHKHPSDDLTSMVLVSEGKIFMRSDAAIEITSKLNGFWRLFRPLKWLPRKPRDMVYDFIAENRYKIFGKRNSCYLPNFTLIENKNNRNSTVYLHPGNGSSSSDWPSSFSKLATGKEEIDHPKYTENSKQPVAISDSN